MSDFSLFKSISDVIISVLPTSPFKDIIYNLDTPYIREVLCYLNWFVPISEIIGILTIWLGSISLYYLYIVILRWVKLIK